MVLDGELKKNKRTGTLDNSHCMVEWRFFGSPMWSRLPSHSFTQPALHIMHDLSHLFINPAASHRQLQKSASIA